MTNESRERLAHAHAMHAIELLVGIEPEVTRDCTAGLLLAGLAAAVQDYEQMCRAEQGGKEP